MYYAILVTLNFKIAKIISKKAYTFSINTIAFKAKI